MAEVGGGNINLTLTAVEPGAAGNSISLTMSSSSPATGEVVEVTVSNTDITVKPVVSGGAVTSTIGDVVNAINADADAKALVGASADEDVLDEVITKNVTETTLAGGSDTVTGESLNDVMYLRPGPGAMLIHGFVAVDKLPGSGLRRRVNTAIAFIK